MCEARLLSIKTKSDRTNAAANTKAEPVVARAVSAWLAAGALLCMLPWYPPRNRSALHVDRGPTAAQFRLRR
jgi:hypothetical protein